MRYQIERTLLRGPGLTSPSERTSHAVMQADGVDPQEALTRALLQDHAELVDEIRTVAGEAFAAARRRGDLWLYRIEEVDRVIPEN